MTKRIIPVLMLLFLTCFVGMVSAQTPEPTQTPYIIYVVVTATPEPVTETLPEDDAQIHRPTSADVIELSNSGESSGEEAITITNTTSNDYAATTDELVSRIVATVMAQTGTTAGGDGSTQINSSAGGAIVHQSDGSTCTMNFQLVNEPTYPAGAVIPRGEVFWKEWNIKNTGTCTWTPEWEFVFDSGWQIGNTRFHMNRTTAPGQTLNVRLAMVPDQKQDGNYYSTYIFEAPDGTRYGTITSSYTVRAASYFVKPTQIPWDKKPQKGRPAGPEGKPWMPPPPPHHRW